MIVSFCAPILHINEISLRLPRWRTLCRLTGYFMINRAIVRHLPTPQNPKKQPAPPHHPSCCLQSRHLSFTRFNANIGNG
ncbi:hypothetical protein HMPREF9098_2147 [Kingella denitrificans ATCC 33394]|uniref:Uncharacterized protein n=1 Tax=Kingella denitrificans ATCC 33394 TaxID=888741 RepID=F0F212_9NEIS|nr:hypothetical protein HMPREF9098_2147 [Kingella denitrificans ATCC 33394]